MTKINALQRGKLSALGPSSGRWLLIVDIADQRPALDKPTNWLETSNNRGPVELHLRLLFLFNFLAIC